MSLVLKIEPFSGVSGDMMLGALLDLGADSALLTNLPASLGLEGAAINVGHADRCGIRCTQVDIQDDTEPVHRHLPDIESLISGSDIPAAAKDFALAVFRILGEAEARVHGVPVEKVHFHEVGAIDSILDIVGAAVLLESLGLLPDGRFLCDPLCVGSGFVTCDHGRLPVPAPATALILEGLPTFAGPVAKEMTTPTGAALIKALHPSFTGAGPCPVLVTSATGYGAGGRDFPDHPNCLRLSLADGAPREETPDMVWQVQANLDDAPGEWLGADLQALLLDRGALDVNLGPVVMKKGRPGQRLEVLCPMEALDPVADAILEQTTTIGVRYFPVRRKVLPREITTVETEFGLVRVKVVTLPSGQLRRMPEYEDCKARAAEHGVSVQQVWRRAGAE
jgi:uncharacterized protein (TIGR00299 family) protein